MTVCTGIGTMFAAALDHPAEIARGQYTGLRRDRHVDDDHGDAAAFGDHDDRVAHGGVGVEQRQVRGEHDLFDENDELTTEGTAGMNPREVFAPKSLLLQQRDGKRVAQHERGGGARRRRKIVRTRLFAHRRIEPDIAVPPERRRRHSGDRDRLYTEALQMGQKPEQLVRLAALRDENRHIVIAYDPEVAVYAVHGVQEGSSRARGGQRRGNLAPDEARLSHARHDHPAGALGDQSNGARERIAKARSELGHGIRLDADHALAAFD